MTAYLQPNQTKQEQKHIIFAFHSTHYTQYGAITHQFQFHIYTDTHLHVGKMGNFTVWLTTNGNTITTSQPKIRFISMIFFYTQITMKSMRIMTISILFYVLYGTNSNTNTIGFCCNRSEWQKPKENAMALLWNNQIKEMNLTTGVSWS